MTFKVSKTTLNLMQECPRCFWLHTVKGVKRPLGIFASIVIKIDSITKNYFDKYRESEKLPPIIEGKIKGKLAKGVPKTLRFRDEKTGLLIEGRFDEHFELEDGSIVAFDHKTKSKAPDGEVHPAYQLQLDVYAYLLKVNGFKTTNKGYLAYYFPKDCEMHNGVDFGCEIVEVETSLERVRELLDKAHEIIHGSIPKPSEECGFCNWHSSVLEHNNP